MLNERTEKVLFAIVESFINTNEPVGSRFITKTYSFNLSPATIRNIMADLEEFGFLAQPHTSAGRIPTDRGYRFYVDFLSRSSEVEDAFIESFITRLEAKREDLNGLLEGAARTLSEHSRYLGLAAPMKSGRTTLNRIELFNYRGNYIAVVLLTDEGPIKHKIIRAGQKLTPGTLRRISDYLNQEFSGYTVDEIRLKLVKEMSREKALCDILITKAVEICREALSFPPGEIYVCGFSDFIGLPDFSSRIREIAGAIEDKHFMLKLLEQVGAGIEGPSVLIGSENPVKEMKDLSLIVSTYKQDGKVAGSIGVIGPTRMDYSRAIVMVQTAARFITEALSQ
ncbi:MAG: heat-inducible transcriptional repressor HrcA [Nitrospiraceae bacterium]|nr:heat-inducible transcriptional repressor HrcA [Nitrospiraceae bacterium]